MNEGLFTNAHGLRLIQEFEGAPRLTARMCEGGAWELSYGVTFHVDGSPIQEGETCTEAEALALFRHALRVFEDGVRGLVTVPLTANQFSALVAFAYNVGLANLAKSTVLRETNAGRNFDAAAAFGMWVYATKNGYMQALRGLLRRRYAEACLFLGYDWTIACDIDAIALQRDKPASLPGRDVVRYKTPFKDVLGVAERYPLDGVPGPELVLSTPAPSVSTPAGKGSAPAAGPSPAGASSSPVPKPVATAGPVVAAGPAAVVPASLPRQQPQPASLPAVIAPPAPVGTKPKSPNTVAPADVPYKIDPQAGLKPLEESDRAKGYVVQQVGIGVIRLGALGVFGSTAQGAAQVVQGDPVLSNLLLMVFVAAGIAAIGYVIKAYGSWKRKRGEKAATQGLY
jgi:lysozyme